MTTRNGTGFDAGERGDEGFDIVEASIEQLAAALQSGEATSVELVEAYLARIARYDRRGPRLNAISVLNPAVFDEAVASDRRRDEGRSRGILDGIPYTAKDSYQVAGLPMSAGSPAFADLIAQEDSFAIERLRASGAVLLGLTNMPPMAGGGMQRGLHGRAESPYNPHFLASAYGSGSSNGSGVATTSNFAAFGLGEETWSSGRAPASCNSLVAYTPSRGMISLRGNWPLFATMDVVVPHTRSVGDLLHLLDAIVVDDSRSEGDFWREQPWVPLPRASDVRPPTFSGLPPLDLRGLRLGVPRLYINADDGGAEPIQTRPSVIAQWEKVRAVLEGLGAIVVEVDFPAVSRYEEDRPGMESMVRRGFVPEGLVHSEMWPLVALTWNRFLERNGDPRYRSLDDVDGEKVFPLPHGSFPDRFDDDPDMADLVEYARGRNDTLETIPHLEEGLRGLEKTRRVDFEDWLDEQALQALVFPAMADVAPFDADFHSSSNEIAWRNGVKYANGNLVLRHLGIPTVTLPMGVMSDTGMPVGLTLAGPAYADAMLLSLARALEDAERGRVAPQALARRESDRLRSRPREPGAANPDLRVEVGVIEDPMRPDGARDLAITVRLAGAAAVEVRVLVDGDPVNGVLRVGGLWTGIATLDAREVYVRHSDWMGPKGPLVTAIAVDAAGRTAGAWRTV